MSIGPLAALPASLAGQALAQTHGSEVERTAREGIAQQLRLTGERKAEAAAGVGETEAEGDETHDRDADGRRLWEDRLDLSQHPREEETGSETAPAEEDKAGAPRPRDPHSTTGMTFDITA